MRRIDTVVIGGSQCGLAMSAALSGQGVDHVVLEAGRVGERWRSERWPSLRLLTPRWLSRLGGWAPGEDDPHGFMASAELVEYLEAYRALMGAPVLEETPVLSVKGRAGGFLVATACGAWRARTVVVATGQSQHARVPAFARSLDSRVRQITPTDYRTPDHLPPGGVLVVGASSTGVQLAREIRMSGRRVVLAVGRHTRIPRTYRGRDILSWLYEMGSLTRAAESMRSLAAARSEPSLQLIGSPDRAEVDLGTLQSLGVEVVGPALGAEGMRMHFSRDLHGILDEADGRWERLRLRIEDFRASGGPAGADIERGAVRRVSRPPRVPESMDLGSEGIGSVVWATGYGRSYPWLRVPVLDGRGEIVQRGGVTPVPGLFTLGLNFQRRRNSSFIAGATDDAQWISRHVQGSLDRAAARETIRYLGGAA